VSFIAIANFLEPLVSAKFEEGSNCKGSTKHYKPIARLAKKNSMFPIRIITSRT